jgi:hypothetical protein
MCLSHHQSRRWQAIKSKAPLKALRKLQKILCNTSDRELSRISCIRGQDNQETLLYPPNVYQEISVQDVEINCSER